VTPCVLDVATGGADLPIALHDWSVQHDRPLQLLASDLNPQVLAVTQREVGARPIALLRHDALRLPFADGAVDIVTCTQALHHFSRDAAAALLRELARVARLGVIINDLRRSYLAYWGARLLAYGPVSALGRHDGPLSVLRAYTPLELSELVQRTTLPAQVRRTPGFRVEIELDKTKLTASASAALRTRTPTEHVDGEG
jgi:SAM-dependent methyltransferase